MIPILDRWRDWFKKDTKPAPVPTPAPDVKAIPWLRVGLILKSIPFSKLKPLFISVPAIVFFALSGLVAWIMLFLKFAVGIFKL
jgi:hypothetical protein